VLRLVAALIPLLSRRVLLRIANGVGWLAFHVARRDRRVALTNLDIAFGPSKTTEEKRRIACSAFQTSARSTLGLFWAPRLDRKTLSEMAEFGAESLRCVEECRARGKGIMFVTMHYYDWEFLGLATALQGIPMTVVAQPTRNPHVTPIVDRLRAITGNRIIPRRSAVTKLFKALKRGESIALLIDQNAPPRRGGLWLDFFGKPVFGYSVAAGLALRTGAAIIPAYLHPLSDGRMHIVYGPEIPCVRTGDDDADLLAISQKCLRFCETVIRRQPEYWLWFYQRWKFRPTTDRGDFPFYSRHIEEVRSRRTQAAAASQRPGVPQETGPQA
jgi:KDO2-lipid IV(A) lauroyltransferase